MNWQLFGKKCDVRGNYKISSGNAWKLYPDVHPPPFINRFPMLWLDLSTQLHTLLPRLPVIDCGHIKKFHPRDVKRSKVATLERNAHMPLLSGPLYYSSSLNTGMAHARKHMLTTPSHFTDLNHSLLYSYIKDRELISFISLRGLFITAA